MARHSPNEVISARIPVKAVKGRIDGNGIARIAALNLVEEQRERLVVVAQRRVRFGDSVP